MAFSSTCAKCGSSSFEVKQNSPKGSTYKLNFVQCSSCGVPIGVLEYFNTGAKIEELEKKMENKMRQLESKISHLESGLNAVNQNIGRVMAAVQQIPKK